MQTWKSLRRASLSAASLWLCAAAPAQAQVKPHNGQLTAGPVAVSAVRLPSFNRLGNGGDTGRLTFRGGLVLSSQHANFGGWSGLEIAADGRRFLAVSDAGGWMSGEIVYDAGAPARLAAVRIGPLLTLKGGNLKRGRDRDAEAVALESGSLDKGSVLVAFEQNGRIARYDFTPHKGVSATRGFIAFPEAAKAVRRKGGFEAMTLMRGGPYKGAIVVFSERLADDNGNRRGFVLTGKTARPLLLKDEGGYDITDVASLEDGSLIVLERRFRWTEGLHVRLRLVRAADLGRAGAAPAETLLDAGLASEIDNLEGLAVHRDAEGTLVLTLISDDNFNRILQRTLLLQFAYANDPAGAGIDPKTPKARP